MLIWHRSLSTDLSPVKISGSMNINDADIRKHWHTFVPIHLAI